MDFGAVSRLRPRMDESTSDLVIQLCTRIGMIMEDACETALTMGEADADQRLERIADIEAASDKIGALIRAARVLTS